VFLNPAFVIDTPPSLPEAGGGYRITGEAENGSVLFSMNFEMQEIADRDGGPAFAFALAVEPSWAGTLARITLTGRGRSAVLDREGDETAVLLRDPATGQVRGLLLDVPTDPDAQADWLTPLSAQDMDVQISRGIPVARF